MKSWLIVTIALLDDIIVLAIVFLVLWLFDVKISLTVGIAAGLVLGGFVFVTHRAIVPSFRRKKLTGAEGMLGLTGTVIDALDPVGTVKIKNEYWTSKSVDGIIETGEDIEVVGIHGLSLEVKRKSQ